MGTGCMYFGRLELGFTFPGAVGVGSRVITTSSGPPPKEEAKNTLPLAPVPSVEPAVPGNKIFLLDSLALCLAVGLSRTTSRVE